MDNVTFPTPYIDEAVKLFALDPTPPLTAEQVVVLYRVVVLGHGLVDQLPTARPLCVPVGSPGSGKTTLARTVGFMVNGPGFNAVGVPATERDFWPVVAAGNPVVFDNAEDPPKWLANALAAATSGVASQARKLYSDAGVVELRARGWIWVTTFSAGLRGDLLDRALIFRLSRPASHFRESDLWAALENALPTIRAEAQAALDEVRRRLEEGPRPTPPPGSGRLADFAALGHLIAEVTGGPEDAALFAEAMRGMQAERDRLAADGNPMLAPLIDFARSPSNYDSTIEAFGLWFTSRQLLGILAHASGGGFDDFKATAQDVARLGKFLSDLVRMASGVLRIEQRTVNGIRQYRITLP